MLGFEGARGVANATTSNRANLPNARTPKYAARILFLEVIAYILRSICIGRLNERFGGDDAPQRDEDVG